MCWFRKAAVTLSRNLEWQHLIFLCLDRLHFTFMVCFITSFITCLHFTHQIVVLELLHTYNYSVLLSWSSLEVFFSYGMARTFRWLSAIFSSDVMRLVFWDVQKHLISSPRWNLWTFSTFSIRIFGENLLNGFNHSALC